MTLTNIRTGMDQLLMADMVWVLNDSWLGFVVDTRFESVVCILVSQVDALLSSVMRHNADDNLI